MEESRGVDWRRLGVGEVKKKPHDFSWGFVYPKILPE
jgi:hypothetical protein